MDVISAIVGVAILVLCALPFILMSRARNKNNIRLIEKLKSLAAEYEGAISTFEVGSVFAIGLDEVSRRVYLVRNLDGSVEYESISLAPFQACEIVQDTHLYENNGESITVIDKINLMFTGGKNNPQSAVLNLFDADRTIELQGELQLARSWRSKINELLLS